MKEILCILLIATCLYILKLCVLEIIKIIKKYKSEKAKIQEEIDKLNHLLDIDKCLLEIMPEDDDWTPDNNFIKECIKECKRRNIDTTSEEIWNELTPN